MGEEHTRRRVRQSLIMKPTPAKPIVLAEKGSPSNMPTRLRQPAGVDSRAVDMTG